MAQAYGGDLLARWFVRHGVTRSEAAKELNVSRVSIWSWINGHSRPLEPVRADIERMTVGEVPRRSWGEAMDRRRKPVPA